MHEAHIMLTTSCNIKCDYCFYHQWQEINIREMMSLETFQHVVDKMTILNCKSIAFTGGEPLLHRELLTFARLAQQAGMNLSITTNGRLLTPELIKKLMDAGISAFHLSIDSLQSKTHSQLRRGSDVDHILAMAKEIQKYGHLDVSFSTVVTATNFNDISHLLLYAAHHKINVVLQPVIYNPDNKQAMQLANFPVNSPEWEKFKKCVGLWARSMHVESYGEQFIEYLEQHNFSASLCTHNASMLVVKPNGDLSPCFFLNSETAFANIKTIEPTEILIRYNSIFRDRISQGKCLTQDCISMLYPRNPVFQG